MSLIWCRHSTTIIFRWTDKYAGENSDVDNRPASLALFLSQLQSSLSHLIPYDCRSLLCQLVAQDIMLCSQPCTDSILNLLRLLETYGIVSLQLNNL